MKRLIARLLGIGSSAARCSCDQRFVGVAHDLDCPVHGLVAQLRRGTRGSG